MEEFDNAQPHQLFIPMNRNRWLGRGWFDLWTRPKLGAPQVFGFGACDIIQLLGWAKTTQRGNPLQRMFIIRRKTQSPVQVERVVWERGGWFRGPLTCRDGWERRGSHLQRWLRGWFQRGKGGLEELSPVQVERDGLGEERVVWKTNSPVQVKRVIWETYSPVQMVEEVDDLVRGAARGQLREADNITEVDGDAVVVLRLHAAPELQLLRHRLGQHLVQQILRSLLLLLQLCRLPCHLQENKGAYQCPGRATSSGLNHIMSSLLQAVTVAIPESILTSICHNLTPEKVSIGGQMTPLNTDVRHNRIYCWYSKALIAPFLSTNRWTMSLGDFHCLVLVNTMDIALEVLKY